MPAPASPESSATRSVPPRRCRATRGTTPSGPFRGSAGTMSTARVHPSGSAVVAVLDTGVDGGQPDLAGRARSGHEHHRRWRSDRRPQRSRNGDGRDHRRRHEQRSRDRRDRLRRREGDAGHRPRCRRAGTGQRHHRGRGLGGRPRRGRDQHVLQQPGLQRRPYRPRSTTRGITMSSSSPPRATTARAARPTRRAIGASSAFRARMSPTGSTRPRTTGPTRSSGRRARAS